MRILFGLGFCRWRKSTAPQLDDEDKDHVPLVQAPSANRYELARILRLHPVGIGHADAHPHAELAGTMAGSAVGWQGVN